MEYSLIWTINGYTPSTSCLNSYSNGILSDTSYDFDRTMGIRS